MSPAIWTVSAGVRRTKIQNGTMWTFEQLKADRAVAYPQRRSDQPRVDRYLEVIDVGRDWCRTCWQWLTRITVGVTGSDFSERPLLDWYLMWSESCQGRAGCPSISAQIQKRAMSTWMNSFISHGRRLCHSNCSETSRAGRTLVIIFFSDSFICLRISTELWNACCANHSFLSEKEVCELFNCTKVWLMFI